MGKCRDFRQLIWHFHFKVHQECVNRCILHNNSTVTVRRFYLIRWLAKSALCFPAIAHMHATKEAEGREKNFWSRFLTWKDLRDKEQLLEYKLMQCVGNLSERTAAKAILHQVHTWVSSQTCSVMPWHWHSLKYFYQASATLILVHNNTAQPLSTTRRTVLAGEWRAPSMGFAHVREEFQLPKKPDAIVNC